MKAPIVKSLPTQADLSEASLEDAFLLVLEPPDKLSLVVENYNAEAAGRLTEKFGLMRPVIIPDGLFDWGTWMLKDNFDIVKFLNRGH